MREEDDWDIKVRKITTRESSSSLPPSDAQAEDSLSLLCRSLISPRVLRPYFVFIFIYMRVMSDHVF